MIIELMKAAQEWKTNKDFNRNALAKVFFYLNEYIATTAKYPYNQDVENYIIEKEHIPNELFAQLGTEVFLAQHQRHQIQENERKASLLKEGWSILTKSVVEEAFAKEQKLILHYKTESIIANEEHQEKFRPYVDNNGHHWLFRPRATRKGICLEQQFNNIIYFYKIV